MMIHVAKIAVSQALYSFDRLYDYEVPKDLIGVIKPGMRVIVPFGAADKETEGMVFEIDFISYDDKIKRIIVPVDEKAVLDDKMIDLAKMMKIRYMCTWADIYRCMVPPGSSVIINRYVNLIEQSNYPKNDNVSRLIQIIKDNGNSVELKKLRNGADMPNFSTVVKKMVNIGIIEIINVYEKTAVEKTVKVVSINTDKEKIKKMIDNDYFKNIKYIRFLEVLMQIPFISVADAKKDFGVSDYMLKKLVKEEITKYSDVAAARSPLYKTNVTGDVKKDLNKQQKEALDGILDLYSDKKFHAALLHGITGSGKTEVYLQLIEHIIKEGKQVIVLVPEISLTPQTVSRFKSRFKTGIAVFHSKLSQGERFDQWKAVLDDKINIIIGARSAVFAPLPHLGMIIIDEEQESSYKSDKTPKYNALEIAAYRCKSTDSVLLLGSATPSINTYYKSETGLMKRFELTKRATEGGVPDIEIVDMKFEMANGNMSILSRKTVAALEETLKTKKQAIILLNRRGYSQYVLCTQCGNVLMCPHCSLTLKYHKTYNRLTCHMCGYTGKMPDVCPSCNTHSLTLPGTGTQKAQEELIKIFPGIRVLRMDMDTVGRKDSYDNILNAFNDKKADILIGTQMVAKGHDFPNVSLSVVMSLDSMLYTGSYNSTEKTFQLVTQAAGRSGRGNEKGRVILQTYNPEHYVIQYAKNQDYKGFYRNEIGLREKLEYPPFCNLGYITLESADDKYAGILISRVKASIDTNYSFKGIIAVLGPAKAPVEKIADRYIWRIIIKSKNLNDLIKLLSGIKNDVEQNVKSKLYRLSIDINPNT